MASASIQRWAISTPVSTLALFRGRRGCAGRAAQRSHNARPFVSARAALNKVALVVLREGYSKLLLPQIERARPVTIESFYRQPHLNTGNPNLRGSTTIGGRSDVPGRQRNW